MHSSTITEYEDSKGRKSAEPKLENGTNMTLPESLKKAIPAKQPLIWTNIIIIAAMHIVGVYLFVIYCRQAKLWTYVFSFLYGNIGGLGITAGIHRLWSHKSYSAKLPLKILLMTCYCMAGQFQPSKWIRIHRVHHRYTDTSADPHDATRGLFYSHIGWLMMKLHPAVKEYGKVVDLSDVHADPVVRFADKYFMLIMPMLTVVVPTVIQVYLWNETWAISISATIIRWLLIVNATSSVNSFAHAWGYRPYNRNIKPTENSTVSMFALGEGWHNYHHTFPWDYRNSEFGRYNPAASVIDLMARCGLAYDLKSPNEKIIQRFLANKGDGTPGVKTKHQS